MSLSVVSTLIARIYLMSLQVASVGHIVQSSSSMRCFLKASGVGALVQFCDRPEDVNDPGDGGGIPVFSFLSISNFGICYVPKKN